MEGITLLVGIAILGILLSIIGLFSLFTQPFAGVVCLLLASPFWIGVGWYVRTKNAAKRTYEENLNKANAMLDNGDNLNGVSKDVPPATQSKEILTAFNKDEMINHYTDISFKIAGVTFKNPDGTSRQNLLKKLKWNNPPFDEKLINELRVSEYNGEPAIGVFCNDLLLGYVPKDMIESFISKWNFISKTMYITVDGGGKGDDGTVLSYGAKVSLSYNSKAELPFRTSTSQPVSFEDSALFEYEDLICKSENGLNPTFKSKAFTLVKNSSKVMQEDIEGLSEEEEIEWYYDIEEGKNMACGLGDVGYFPNSADDILDNKYVYGAFVEELIFTDNDKIKVRVRVFYKD